MTIYFLCLENRGKEYEVILPTGEIVDYDSFKDSLSASASRRKTDPYKFDHKNQMIDNQGKFISIQQWL